VETWISAIKTVFIVSFFTNTFALWLIVGFIFYNTSKSWRRVTEVAKTVAAGETPEIPKKNFTGDGGVIVNALDTMVDKIEKERQYLQEALNTLEDAIAVVDDNYQIIIRNAQLEKQFNNGQSISEGENIFQIIQSSEVLNSLSGVYESSKADDFEFKFLKSQEKRFYYAHIEPIEHYEKKRFFMFFKDVSSLRKLQAIRRDFH
jgi:transcriptional regulator with PAS, ATPase and Fis domain